MTYTGTVVRPVSEDKPLTHHTLRYYPGTELRDAKHGYTLVKVPFGEDGPTVSGWVEAENARLLVPMPFRDLLQVVER